MVRVADGEAGPVSHLKPVLHPNHPDPLAGLGVPLQLTAGESKLGAGVGVVDEEVRGASRVAFVGHHGCPVTTVAKLVEVAVAFLEGAVT